MKKIVISFFISLLPLATFADDSLDYYKKGRELLDANRATEAVAMFEQSLGLGFTDSAYELGRIYNWGIGVGKNYPLAQKYYLQAAKNGNGEAQFSLYIMDEMGVSTLTKKEATEWLLAAANNDIPDAIYELARYYKHHAQFGKCQQAMKDAAEKGCTAAKADLGMAWYEGNFVWTGERKDYDQAFKYLSEIAPELDDSYLREEVIAACYLTLSKCYRFGRGVKADEKKADYYLNKAAAYNDPATIDVQRILNGE